MTDFLTLVKNFSKKFRDTEHEIDELNQYLVSRSYQFTAVVSLYESIARCDTDEHSDKTAIKKILFQRMSRRAMNKYCYELLESETEHKDTSEGYDANQKNVYALTAKITVNKTDLMIIDELYDHLDVFTYL